MKRNHASPLGLWLDLAVKTQEMMVASASVIGHRTSRMAAAGIVPAERDQREFTRMWQEKIDAGARSTAAMALDATAADYALGATAFAAMARNAAAFWSLASSRTPGQFVARQAALARAVTDSVASANAAASSAARLAHRGMKPFHAASTRNARRLSGR
jgi:hypothetical protein